MVPLQPAAGVDVGFAQRWLAGLQSHNCTDAREWPALSAVPGAGGDALRSLERLPPAALAPFARRAALFVQLQALQRGAIVHAHVDEPGVGGEAIATAVIAGASEARGPRCRPSLAATPVPNSYRPRLLICPLTCPALP